MVKKAETTRTRTVKLTDNAKTNVTNMATYRLNKMLDAIRVFGNCCGKSYEWTPEQIAKAENIGFEAFNTALANIRNGKKEVVQTVKL